MVTTYITKDGVGTYLPPAFWYEGMFKSKAGKGYKNLKTGETEIIGVESGPCEECDGTVVSLKMNTTSKGFETTSEKVCPECGLIHNGAFQVMEPKKDYKARHYETHEEWVEDMTPSDKSNEDVAWDMELYEHINGFRRDTQDNSAYSDLPLMRDGGKAWLKKGTGAFILDAKSRQEYDDLSYDLGLKSKGKLGVKAEHWNRNSEDVLKHRMYQYYDMIDINKTLYGMNNYQVSEVKYILEHKSQILNISRYSSEDIILALCIYVMKQSMNKSMYGVLTRQIPGWKHNIRNIVSLVEQKLS